jgi:hypothetical protein
MLSTRSRGVWRAGPALAVATGLLAAAASSPARAGDDGAAPIWVGLYSLVQPIVGWGADDKDDPSIDYRDHGRLVLPPKMELPPPATSPAASNPAWPVDNEQQKKKKAKAESEKVKIEHYGRPTPPRPDGNGTVTVNANVEDTAARKPKCERTAAPGDTCTQTASSSFSWNPLTWVGVQKKESATLGPEPDRDWLTDPPKGYRAPVEGVGVKADN